MKAKVLIVDDEEFSATVLEEFLGDQFSFEHAPSGKDALAAVAIAHPTVILMDVEMPGGMNGYQACRALKDNHATQSIPVIFISAYSKAEDRLKAYESGGDDYVSKPFNVEEIRHKITLAKANQETRNALAEKARQATSTAMLSMREAANAGVVLGFLSDIFRQSGLAEIAATTLHILQQFQIEGAVQLRDGHDHVSLNTTGACTPVEDAVLTKMAGDNRIVDLGSRSAFNFDQASIIVYNMPTQDPALYGRLKDTVLKVAEALDLRMRSLASELSAAANGDTRSGPSQRNAALLRDIEARIKAQREESLRIMNRLCAGIENFAMALSGEQQLLVRDLTRDAQVQMQAVHGDGLDIERMMQSLHLGGNHASAGTSSVSDSSAKPFKSVELF